MRLTIRSFGAKLLLLSLLTSGAAILVTCATQLISQREQTRSYFQGSARAASTIVASNLSAAVSFKDKQAILEILSSLRQGEGFVAARVMDLKNEELASISVEGYDYTLIFPPNQFRGQLLSQDWIEIDAPIRFGDGESVGTLQFIADFSPYQQHLNRATSVTLTVGAAAMLVAVCLGRLAQKRILKPVVELRKVASHVSEQQDYTVRATKRSDDELGHLTETFNTMLDRIEMDNRALADANATLENRVKERTTELELATREAQQASTAKSYFLANMSHEIRTPMTAILGYSEQLLDPSISEVERLDCVRTIHRNGEHLLAIINDILDVTKIEAGRMSVERIKVNVIQIVGEVASLCRVKAIEKGLSMSINFDGGIPEFIHSDPTRLRQILVNLVNNAIKFTERGEVRVSVSAKQSDSGTWSVIFSVRDTGIGMTPEQAARLFKSFTQADESMSRRFGGTGLGLVISRSLARILGGDISVQSQVGLGSCFTAHIDGGAAEGAAMRYGVSEAECLASVQHVDVSGSVTTAAQYRLDLRMLLVEDGPDNQRFISALLRKAGAEVTIAENGAIAVEEALGALEQGRPFDVILMDMQMPVMDGYSATRLLRSKGYQGLIIALTAHAMVEDRQKCEQAGCDDYLTKPVHRVRMLERLAQIHGVGRLAQADTKELTSVAPAVPALATAAAAEKAERVSTSLSKPEIADPIYSSLEADPDFGDLVVTFAQLLDERCADLQKAVDARDESALRVLSHQLKGSAGTHGFNSIGQCARALESEVKAGNWARIETAMATLKQFCGRVRLRSAGASQGQRRAA